MTTIKVKFRPSTVKDRPGSIVYLVTRRRTVRQITTAYKVFPFEWDKRQSKVICCSNDRVDTIRSVIQGIRRDVEKLNRIINRFDNQYTDYTSDEIVAEFHRHSQANAFFSYMDGVIMRLRQLNHTGTANNYRAALGSFKRFRNDEDVCIESIDHFLIEDYQAYLISTSVKPNSISFYMRILRAVYNRAVEQELTQDRKPFRSVFTGMEKTPKRAISIHDIRRINNLEFSSRPNLEFARDIFMFLFFCRGMSFIDAAFLKKTDVKNGVINYRRHKTNQYLHIKIVKPIQDLIDRYSFSESPYLLSIVVRPGIDERKQYEAALRRINNALKTIAEIIKLPIPLTTYVSRHSWATIAKSKNVPVNVISDALGHDSVSTTQIYLASIDTAVIDRANDMVIRDL